MGKAPSDGPRSARSKRAARRIVVVLLLVRVGRALIDLDVHGPHDAPVLIGVGGGRTNRDCHARVRHRAGLVIQGLLFDVGQDQHRPVGSERFGQVEKIVLVLARRPPRNARRRREPLKRAFIVGKGQPNLLEIVRALGPPRRFASRLHRRQEQRHQDTDDRDHHEQLHQREAARAI